MSRPWQEIEQPSSIEAVHLRYRHCDGWRISNIRARPPNESKRYTRSICDIDHQAPMRVKIIGWYQNIARDQQIAHPSIPKVEQADYIEEK